MNSHHSKARLADCNIIITGASSGIGAAAARLFAQEGARLVLGARRSSELERLTQELTEQGAAATFLAGDVRDENYARALVQLAIEEHGGLDAAFNNAGMMGDAVPLTEMTSDNWQQVLATNLTSAFFAAKYQLPAMKKRGGGSLVFTSSFVGTTAALPGMSAYAASKAGLVGLTQALATEHGPDNIRVNALLPGGTRTPMAGDLDENPELEQFYAGLHALKRIAEPREIAQAALFLVSGEASFVTGSAFIVDGGNSICKV